MKTITRNVLLVLAALVAMLTVAACGSGGLNDSDEAGAGDVAATESDAKYDDEANGALDGGAPDPAANAPGDDGRPAPRSAVQTRAVISTGSVSLRSKDVAASLNDVQKVIDRHFGEISEDETNTGENGEVTWSRQVIRVPSKEFGATMTELKEVAELESATRSSEDVTTQVIDNEVRIRAQTKSLERIEALLARANTLQEIVSIEAQLTRRQADLDSLKAQQAWLADQTSLSTIAVHIEKIGEADPDEDDGSGFLAGLKDGWNALKSLGSGTATVAGAVLPFAVVFALLGVPVWLALRGVRRNRPPAAQASAE